PFDPREHGWIKMEYRQGDVRDAAALRAGFEGADVVVHLAFMITGNAPAKTIREINVTGTLNAFRAAGDAGAQRFIYASSVAAYGFHADNPVGMREDWPVRPADRLFYAREKAELEEILWREARANHGPALYMVRPPIVLGPHAAGAKEFLPRPLERAGRRLLAAAGRLRLPVPAPKAPVQFIHQDDVGQALLKCVLGEGPPGAYNIAGDGVLYGTDLVRELGFTPVPVPAQVFHRAARAAAAVPRVPLLPPATDWVEALSHPAIMDTTKARVQLRWRPKYSALEALRDTLR
ncbi:MAG TPA: NAD-dependent epimerase/dehydratase family protein, partial [Chloroflexota bacterium]|nr:NAD-dependent epimerase/dehydratase family protein [Chloroflexota bacterium]